MRTSGALIPRIKSGSAAAARRAPRYHVPATSRLARALAMSVVFPGPALPPTQMSGLSSSASRLRVPSTIPGISHPRFFSDRLSSSAVWTSATSRRNPPDDLRCTPHRECGWTYSMSGAGRAGGSAVAVRTSGTIHMNSISPRSCIRALQQWRISDLQPPAVVHERRRGQNHHDEHSLEVGQAFDLEAAWLAVQAPLAEVLTVVAQQLVSIFTDAHARAPDCFLGRKERARRA